MYKTIMAGVAGALFAGGAAMASEPVQLTNGQMDDVTAGLSIRAGLGGGFGSGAIVSTTGLGTGSSQVNTGGGAVFEDVLLVNTGGLALSSTGLAEGFANGTTSYASTNGGFSDTGALLSGGLVLYYDD